MKNRHLKFAIVLLALGLSVCGCSQSPQTPPSASQPESNQTDCEAEKNLPGLFLVYNYESDRQTLLVDGEVRDRGYLNLISDRISGETKGYSKSENGMLTVYHPDGSVWYEAGEKKIYDILGDYFEVYGNAMDDAVGCTLVHTQTGQEAVLEGGPYWYIQTSPDGYVIAYGQNEQEKTAALVMDSSLNVLHEFENARECYPILQSGKTVALQLYFEPKDDIKGFDPAVYDMEKSQMTPYSDMKILDNGIRVCQYIEDELCDVLDAEGNMLEEATPNLYFEYEDDFKYYLNREQDCYIVDWAGLSYSTTGYVDVGRWADCMYIQDWDCNTVGLYDADGNELKFFVQDEESGRYSVSACGDLLLIGMADQSSYRLYKDKEIIREITGLSELWGCSLYELNDDRAVLWTYGKGNGRNYYHMGELLDAQGNTIVANCKTINTTHTPGVYFVQKGFNYGLMDKNGNWLWSRSIFADSAVDEREYGGF